MVVEAPALGLPFVAPPPVGPASLASETHFGVWTADFEAVRSWGTGAEGQLGLLMGLRIGKAFDKREEWLHAGSSRYHVGLAESDLLFGPSLGLWGARRWGRSGLAGLARVALLSGDFDHEAFSIDFGQTIDAERVVMTTESAAVLNIDLKLAYLFRISKRYAAGIGYFAQFWSQMPLAPIGGDLNGPLVFREGDPVVHGILGTFALSWGRQ